MSLGGGDQLARGAKSATFPSLSSVKAIKFDYTFMDAKLFKRTYGISKKEYAESLK